MRRFAQFPIALTLAAVGGLLGFMSVAAAQPGAPSLAAPNYQGLWWNVPPGSESGWGVNFAHQGDTIFASWFTYDAAGKAWWLSMTANPIGNNVYSGTLYQTRGPAFNAVPFDATAVTYQAVGSGTLTFSDANAGQFSYTVNGISETKAITRTVFGPLPSCTFQAQPELTGATNYTDIWWVANGAESGWGVNLTHQGEIVFASWFTYDSDGTPLWLSATTPKVGTGLYNGTLYRTTGPAFGTVPFDPNRVTYAPAGRLTITFADGNRATFAYTTYGVTQTKAITRTVFYPPAGTVCSGPLRVPSALTVASPTPSPWVGETVQLSATVRDQFGYVIEGTTPTWSSSSPDVATISANGALQGQATGPVVMTASIGSVSGSVSLTVAPMPRISVAVGTTKEVVFHWATDRCEDGDAPDQPARVVRAEDGSLVLIAGNAPRIYLSRGADFASLKRNCSQPALISADLNNPESYENYEWLWVVYREGPTWHALIHNEYHDPVALTCKPGVTRPDNPCWYNSITHAVSTDGGHNFAKPLAPAHVVAPAPRLWVPPPAPVSEFYAEGYRSPSNIVRGTDGYYYAFMNAIPSTNATQRLCVFRADTLGDPASWRTWDGRGFNLGMTSPYLTVSSVPPCAALNPPEFPGPANVDGLVYNTYLERYLRTAIYWNYDGHYVCAFSFSLSADLIHWSVPQVLAEVETQFCSVGPDRPDVLERMTTNYPAIIDHADTTINFERAGRTPYLYYVRFNRTTMSDPLYWVDRDLVRVPLTFTRTD